MIWSNNASWSKYFQAIVEIILIFEPFEKYKNFLLSFDFFSAPMKSGLPLHSVGEDSNIIYYFLFQWFYFQIPTALQPMTGIEGFKYQASDG